MTIEESAGYLISNTGRKLSQLLTTRFQAYDITSEQWSVLNRLCRKEAVTQRELAERADKDPTNLTRILDQLERKLLIRREPNRDDRRSFLLYATERGRQLDRELEPMEQALVRELLEGVDAEAYAAFRGVIARIGRNADRLRERAER